jgi:hypothetical protein
MTIDRQIEILREFDEQTEISEMICSLLNAAEKMQNVYPNLAQITLETAKYIISDQIPWIPGYEDIIFSHDLLTLVGLSDD